jgi:membrane protein YdbS with pleckstrin-like domain
MSDLDSARYQQMILMAILYLLCFVIIVILQRFRILGGLTKSAMAAIVTTLVAIMYTVLIFRGRP